MLEGVVVANMVVSCEQQKTIALGTAWQPTFNKKTFDSDKAKTYFGNFCDVTLPVDKFIDVLKSLAAVENLQLSNLIIKVEGSHSRPYFDHLDKYHYDRRDCYVEFQEAFEIIKRQFPIATGLFQIYDDQDNGHSILKEKMKKPVLDKSPPWEDLFKDKTRYW